LLRCTFVRRGRTLLIEMSGAGSEGVVPPTPTPAPAPSPIGPVSCALEYLVNAGNYNTLIELVEAASESAAIAREPCFHF